MGLKVGPMDLGGSESVSEYGTAYWHLRARGRSQGREVREDVAHLASMCPGPLGERDHAIDVDAGVYALGKMLHPSGIAGGTNGCFTASDPCCIG